MSFSMYGRFGLKCSQTLNVHCLGISSSWSVFGKCKCREVVFLNFIEQLLKCRRRSNLLRICTLELQKHNGQWRDVLWEFWILFWRNLSSTKRLVNNSRLQRFCSNPPARLSTGCVERNVVSEWNNALEGRLVAAAQYWAHSNLPCGPYRLELQKHTGQWRTSYE